MLFRLFILAGLIGLAGGCGDGGFPRDAAEPAAAVMGTVSLAWSLRDLSDQPVQCDQVGASTVFLQLRNRATLSGVAASLSCKTSPSTSQLLEPGVYDVTFELHGLNLTLATASGQNAVVVDAGRDTLLAPVTFVIDATGGLALALAAPPSPSNCKDTGTGAGITGVTIELVHTGGPCATVTFLRSRGRSRWARTPSTAARRWSPRASRTTRRSPSPACSRDRTRSTSAARSAPPTAGGTTTRCRSRRSARG